MNKFTMVGLGAWLVSIVIVGFQAITSLMQEGGAVTGVPPRVAGAKWRLSIWWAMNAFTGRRILIGSFMFSPCRCIFCCLPLGYYSLSWGWFSGASSYST
jgi:hypothetical protein